MLYSDFTLNDFKAEFLRLNSPLMVKGFEWIARFILIIIFMSQCAYAADPQNYTVSILKTENTQLDQAMKDVSTLIKLNQIAPVGPFALISRTQGDVKNFNTVLRSFGFYKGTVSIRMAGLALDDPALINLLETNSAQQSVEIEVTIELGPLFHIGKLEIQGKLPENFQKKLALAPGMPALANTILAGRDKLLLALQEQGYALAKVEEPTAYLVPEKNLLDLVFPVKTGDQVDLGDIQVKGLKRVNESFVRNRLIIKSGTRFDPVLIEKARQDLSSIGVFSSVRVKSQESLDLNQRLPIQFDVVERARRAASVEANYYTDLGGSLAVSWQHRNLFGNAESLLLKGGVTQLAGNSTIGIGYNGLASFLKPDFLHRDQTFQVNLKAFKQHLLAYDQTAAIAEVLLSRRYSEHWNFSIGLSAEQSEVTQQGTTYDYTLVSIPLVFKYDTTNSLLDPTRGIRAAATITPTQPIAGSKNNLFVQSQIVGSTYLDFSNKGRSVLALRGVMSHTGGASRFDVPPDKRAYAGGSSTVRGFKFQSIGPRFPDDTPQGGMAMAAGTLEFRQRFFDNWGAVLFADAGQVSASGSPFAGSWLMGAGAGLRYYTSFGPVRFDFALPVNPQPGSGSFQIYVSLGQAF